MENNEKRGLLSLGGVFNLKLNERGENCITLLSKRTKEKVSRKELDDFIDSPDFVKEYIDEEGNSIDESHALEFRFKLPWKDSDTEQHVYGYFVRRSFEENFVGVVWKTLDWNFFYKYGGVINSGSWKRLKELSGVQGISKNTISKYIISEIKYFNGAGYDKYSDGTPVTAERGTYIKFTTNLHTHDGESIVGWFTKIQKQKYEGINWGTDKDFRNALSETRELKDKFYVGRMIFDSNDSCNSFLEELNGKIIPETWEYKHKRDAVFKYPILRSYLQFELERLYLEKDDERFKYPDTIIYNRNHKRVLFNTNLINSYGHDLCIVGNLVILSYKEYIENLIISPSKTELIKWGFDNINPKTPQFFQDINEIVFHCDWIIDNDMERYDHIIKERRERFPEKYRSLKTDDLGQKLDKAIDFAKRIAQRNYKFIVPMYYPARERIQLLMPIYMETTYDTKVLPDFALVLTPNAELEIYTPETILGLDEVYQDARLIAKPEESWLNPEMIE